ncbi:hypothetical protein FOA52_011397 [Chlamydomonas sp. UWO 241]|nr:hypothetical protein FOA52_011397 [Chlamydomonas sp. UWO 241]
MPPPSRRDLANLLRKLDSNASLQALTTILELCCDESNRAVLAAAGAIPPLVRLLGPEVPVDVQMNSAAVLSTLADHNTANAFSIATAGAIAPLVRLLRSPGAFKSVHLNASGALVALVESDIAQIAAGIAAAGAIPPLVKLLGSDSPAMLQQNAARLLGSLAQHAEYAASIAGAGAVRPLVRLLGLGHSAKFPLVASSDGDAGRAPWRRTQHCCCGAIPPLVQLLGRGSGSNVQREAATAPGKLVRINEAHAVPIADAGAVPLLLQLIGPGADSIMKQIVAATLIFLANVPEVAPVVVAAGAVPPLVQLLGPGTNPVTQQNAATALVSLAAHAGAAQAIVAGGAIPHLVRLLAPDPGPHAFVKQNSGAALLGVLAKRAAVAQKIVAAGAVPALVKLLVANLDAFVQQNAAMALGRLAQDDDVAAIVAADAIPALVQLALGPGASAAPPEAARQATVAELTRLFSGAADGAGPVQPRASTDDDTRVSTALSTLRTLNRDSAERRVLVAFATAGVLAEMEWRRCYRPEDTQA